MLSRAEESFYRSARAWARYQAARCGIDGDLAEELEQGFVVKWLFKPIEPPIWTWPAGRRESYLRRSARNYTLNFVESLRSERASLAAYAMSLYDDDAPLPELELVQPEKRLFRSLFWRQIYSGLRGLRPAAGDLTSSYLCGDTICELSSASGRTKHAVNQSLSSARKRLRAILMAQGNTETELRSYVPLIVPERMPENRLSAECISALQLDDVDFGEAPASAPATDRAAVRKFQERKR